MYKDGGLRPLEPLPLEELQQVTVTITDPPVIDAVRQAFSKIAGSLSDAVIAQRQER